MDDTYAYWEEMHSRYWEQEVQELEAGISQEYLRSRTTYQWKREIRYEVTEYVVKNPTLPPRRLGLCLWLLISKPLECHG
jgi:hypothetical protein